MMLDKKAVNRIEKFKDDIYFLDSMSAVGLHENNEEFDLDDLDSPEVLKKIEEEGGFRVQGLNIGEFSGDYWVRLSCGVLNKPFLDDDCKLVAEIDVDREIEPIEVEILETIDENLAINACKDSEYPDLCEKTVSMGLMTRLGDNFSDSFRKSVEHDLTDYFDFVEFIKK